MREFDPHFLLIADKDNRQFMNVIVNTTPGGTKTPIIPI